MNPLRNEKTLKILNVYRTFWTIETQSGALLSTGRQSLSRLEAIKLATSQECLVNWRKNLIRMHDTDKPESSRIVCVPSQCVTLCECDAFEEAMERQETVQIGTTIAEFIRD